ncbi:ribosome biogenesis protein BMS1 homolog [Daktulosphaira vitifoliae]|uniref:ribosome biogenesis protein BMS1 homolog n=1 Tax=Daktulosphaira vitifoliae TaxID=58002 RepID=UPI0021AA835C|nr:ribosome biogenesis protein BMS1 homolog [Daktulosphaira vitifoliae]
MGEEFDDKKKEHRKPHSGRKAEKKDNVKKKYDQNVESAKKRNPKAFAINSVVSAQRRFRRTQDLDTKKQHIPLVDRTPLEPPPIVVVVVGPPKVGKTTLINCVIKNFTRQPLTAISGPVTIVSGKRRRITIIECNNDINSMIDLAKVADLVLLMIDASFGFEMEIFEFLNICQVHGMPKIMGVLSHLDMLKNNKALKRTKKLLKHRFWTEVYAGAKLFYLSGIHRGEYLRNEVKNLGRFISVMKFRPLTWQTSHSYVLVDRMEDLTPPEAIRQDEKCDRRVSLYGFVRGIPLNKKSSVHIPGCGDSAIYDMCFLPDPCPIPDKTKKRSLVDKERLVYAPFSGVGGIVYDKDAVYVELGGSHSHSKIMNNAGEEAPGRELVNNIVETQETLDQKMARSEVQLFSNTKPIISTDFREDADMVEDNNMSVENVEDPIDGHIRRKVIFRSDDMKFSDLDDDSYSEDLNDDNVITDKEDDNADENNSSSDSVWTDSEEEIGNKTNLGDQSRFYGRSFGKENEIHKKIADELAKLDKINMESNFKKWSNEDEEISNDEVEYDEDSDDSDDSHENFDDEESQDDVDVYSDNDIDDSNEKEKGVLCNDIKIDKSIEDINKDTALNWKKNLAQKATNAYYERQNSMANLWKLVYEDEIKQKKNDIKEDEDELGGLFRLSNIKNMKKQSQKEDMDKEDTSKFIIDHYHDWNLAEVCDSIRDMFVTGKWKHSEDAAALLEENDNDELYGDFEDLETGEIVVNDDYNSDDSNIQKPNKPLTEEELKEKKKKLKQQFDEDYDDKEGGPNTYYEELKEEASRQAQLNKSQFEGMDDEIRVLLEGFRAGMYVRLELDSMPCELVSNFDPTYPLIVGGLQSGEENIGYLKLRIKKHRWYNKILKNRDPLIISMGWRRFQTLPIYSKQEDNMRYRMLKYTPEHVMCMAHIWGPITKPGTGFLAVQDVASIQSGFRITATGTVVDSDQSTQVTKKLKLTGTPLKIYKRTAFVKDMFNSTLEVTKFEGARIKTVSGIRGQIKKACLKPEGSFRATFEDKIKISDIIFCRTWYNVEVPKLYNPVTSLLLPLHDKNSWRGMKTTGQLKREQGIKGLPQEDSMYTPIHRTMKYFKPLKISKNLQAQLPYKDKPKTLVTAKRDLKKQRVAVVRDGHEEQVASLMKMIRTTYKEKKRKERKDMRIRVRQHKKDIQTEVRAKYKRDQQKKKAIMRKRSKMSSNK